jgi:hypothetical protein
MRFNSKTVFFTAIAAFCTLFIPNTASGQFEYMAEAMQPEYMARDLITFAEGLNLDDTQEVIVEAMFDSYEDDFQNGWAATQERLNTVAEEIKLNNPSSRKETLEPVLNALSDWLIEKRTLDEGLLENVHVILVGHQRELWVGFSRRLYREKHMKRGRLSGESVDLFQITRDTDLSPASEARISDYLEEYSIALDAAMRTRDNILRGNPKKLFDNILSDNTTQSPDRVDNEIHARVAIRDLNDQYIEIISGNLSNNEGENFRSRALKRGYARIFRRTPAQLILRQAVENDNYDEGLRAQIVQLEASYLTELSLLNFNLLERTRSFEPVRHRNRALAGQIRKNGGTPQKIEDPTRDLYKEREALGKRYIDMLQALLTPEQFLELDGSRRWAPRAEPSFTRPASPASGKDGSLSLSGGSSKSKGKGKDKDGKGNSSKRQPQGGTSQTKEGAGLGGPRR